MAKNMGLGLQGSIHGPLSFLGCKWPRQIYLRTVHWSLHLRGVLVRQALADGCWALEHLDTTFPTAIERDRCACSGVVKVFYYQTSIISMIEFMTVFKIPDQLLCSMNGAVTDNAYVPTPGRVGEPLYVAAVLRRDCNLG
jgi:hypothetical protein